MSDRPATVTTCLAKWLWAAFVIAPVARIGEQARRALRPALRHIHLAAHGIEEPILQHMASEKSCIPRRPSGTGLEGSKQLLSRVVLAPLQTPGAALRILATTILLSCLSLTFLSPAGSAAELGLAAWNLEHLNDTDWEGCIPRRAADYAALRRRAMALDADIVAFQEVENAAAARRVFPRPTGMCKCRAAPRPERVRSAAAARALTLTRISQVNFGVGPFER